jgi:cobalt-precorrin 5A hydrolase
MIAIGVGCRRGVSAAAIEGLVGEVLARVPAGERRLFTIVDKEGEAGLIEAAVRLGLELTFVARDALRGQAGLVRTPSPAAEATFGVPSVAEAAALAGAGAGASLIVSRVIREGVTCAVAVS